MPPIINSRHFSKRTQQAATTLLRSIRRRDASSGIKASSIRHVLNSLTRRQDQPANNGPVSDPTVGVIIPSTYAGIDKDMGPGSVAGIVLGAILGFLLLCFILTWACAAQQNTFSTADETIEVRDRRARSRSPRRRSRRGSAYAEEVRVSRDRSRSPRSPRSPRRTQIVTERVTEERIPVPRSRGPSPGGPPPPPPPPPIIVDDRRSRRHSGDEMVEVIEEESDYSTLPSRRKSRRRSGGYTRTVDPDRYAGGDYPRRSVRGQWDN